MFVLIPLLHCLLVVVYPTAAAAAAAAFHLYLPLHLPEQQQHLHSSFIFAECKFSSSSPRSTWCNRLMQASSSSSDDCSSSSSRSSNRDMIASDTQQQQEEEEENLQNSLGRPHDACYYVSSNLLAGEYPKSQQLDTYLDLGIYHFIDLTQPGEKQSYDGILQKQAEKRGIQVSYRRFPIPDFGIPSSLDTMKQILYEMDQLISQNKNSKVYVHCRGGIGRTGTVIGCHLVRSRGLSGEEALIKVNDLFRQYSSRSAESSCSPETREQMEFVQNWRED